MKIKMDLFEAAHVSFGDNPGLIRTHFVSEVDSGIDMHLRACAHPKIGTIGTPYSKDPQFAIKRIHGVPASDTSAIIRVEYWCPQTGWNAQQQQQQSGGKPKFIINDDVSIAMELTETCAVPPGRLKMGKPICMLKETGNKELWRLVKLPSYSATRIVTAQTNMDGPVSEAVKDLASCINAKPWYGKPARTWLFCGVRTNADSNDMTFDTQLIFWYRARGWDEYAMWEGENGWRDPDIEPVLYDDIPAGDLHGSGLGWLGANVQWPVDFNSFFRVAWPFITLLK
jgi:hypothetical protein